MTFADRLWMHLVEDHDAHLAAGPADEPSRGRSRRGRHRAGLRVGAVTLVAAAAVVVFVLVTQGSSARSSWSARVMRRAAAFVAPPARPDRILHIDATETRTAADVRESHSPDPGVASLTEDVWIQQGKPWGERAVLRPQDGDVYVRNSHDVVYDETTHQVMRPTAVPSGHLHYQVVAGTTPGSHRLRVRINGRTRTIAVTGAQLMQLHAGTAEVQTFVGWNGHAQIVSAMVMSTRRGGFRGQASPASSDFSQVLHGLLSAGDATVSRTKLDGRSVLRIDAVHPPTGPHTIYDVDPRTYAPVQVQWLGLHPDDVTTIRIHAFRTLPLAGHRGLLRLGAPADATVDPSRADYWYALGLPSPF